MKTRCAAPRRFSTKTRATGSTASRRSGHGSNCASARPPTHWNRRSTCPPASVSVDCVVAEASTGVVYYTPAPPDGSVPSRIVWTIPSGVPVAATWQEVTSVHHEGLPGHHLQFVVTASYPDLHPWQRHLCHIHGYAEGWAHYAEQLADELGTHPRSRRTTRTAARSDLALGAHRGRHRSAHRLGGALEHPRERDGVDAGARPADADRPRARRAPPRRLRGRPISRLARTGARVQGGRAALERRPRGPCRCGRRRVLAARVPPGCAGSRPDGPRAAPRPAARPVIHRRGAR